MSQHQCDTHSPPPHTHTHHLSLVASSDPKPFSVRFFLQFVCLVLGWNQNPRVQRCTSILQPEQDLNYSKPPQAGEASGSLEQRHRWPTQLPPNLLFLLCLLWMHADRCLLKLQEFPTFLWTKTVPQQTVTIKTSSILLIPISKESPKSSILRSTITQTLSKSTH